MTLCTKDHKTLLFDDFPKHFPGYACLLGNVLEVAGVSFIQPEAFDMVSNLAHSMDMYLTGEEAMSN